MVNRSLLTSSSRSPCFTITSDWFEWQRSQKTNSILGSPVSVHGLLHYQLYVTNLRRISLSFYSIVGENLEKVTPGRMTRLAVSHVASDINRRAQSQTRLRGLPTQEKILRGLSYARQGEFA